MDKPYATGAERDFIDLRDYPYVPRLTALPATHLPWQDLLAPDDPGMLAVGVRNQGKRSNCVGQAMASLIDIQMRARQSPVGGRISAAMLYRMARFHDLPGQTKGQAEGEGQTRAEGSTLRSAIKAFFHHGACLDSDWPDNDDTTPWPNDKQAQAAEEYTLGAYSRLQPILHHYHCAIVEAGAVIVTALLHDGWKCPDAEGFIEPAEPDPAWGCHAFVIVGYNRDGFLVLNSWGPDWGGVPTGDGDDAPLARGMAIWKYADWARCVADGWVLRLGVPGREAFAVGAGEQGIARSLAAEAQASTPYRMLRGHFLNLDAGRLQETGAYATPGPAAEATIDRIKTNLLSNDCKGLVLALPGIMDNESKAFEKAARMKFRLAAEHVDFLTCFWSANFAAEMHAVLHDIFERCRKRMGNSANSQDMLNTLFEETARGAGRAFWRDIERHAYCAAMPCDPNAGPWEEKRSCDIKPRGKLGEVFETLAKACAGAGKPLHIYANGAGALVADGLIQRASTRSADPLDWIPALGNLVLTFPAVPLDQAEDRILRLARAMVARTPGSARILVPTPGLEQRLSVNGYGHSILELVSRAFLEPDEKGRLRPMLGSSRAAATSAVGGAKTEPPFEPFELKSLFRLEQAELENNADLEAAVIKALTAETSRPPRPATQAPPQPIKQELVMNSMDTPRITLADLQRKIQDNSLTPAEAQRYFHVDEAASGPFSPVLVINRAMVEMPPGGSRSALAMNSANSAARWLRMANYHARIGGGYEGIRIAAEGDSWYQYPLRLYDVIDYVADTYAVYDTSAAGDLLENMARQREYIGALKQSGAGILLLSAGGNDVCAGGKLAEHLEDFDPALKPADYLKRSYQAVMDNAIASYERICRDVSQNFPGVTIITHGYDYVIPNNGRWLGKPMASRGITDRSLQRGIAAEMIDQFNRGLRRMAATMGHVAYVDCRNCVAANQWFDELHPTNGGFAKVASRFMTKIKEIEQKSRAQERVVKQISRGRRAAGVREWQATPQALVGPVNLARSLHIGLNAIDPGHYAGDSGILFGCENDARAMREMAEIQGYSTRMLLTEEATREAVIDELRRAARDLRAGDQFLFTNACHGSQISDMNGDEGRKGKPDSTLCLYDSQLIDDELWDIFSGFASGVRIVMIADSCHSGSVARKGVVPLLLADDTALGLARPPGRVRSLNAAVAREVEAMNRDFYERIARELPHVDRSVLTSPIKSRIAASVIQFSACLDDQSAMDGDENGVFTAALLRVWDRGRFTGNYEKFHHCIQQELAGMEQKPDLFRPEPVDPAFSQQRPFTLVGAELNLDIEGIRMNGAQASDPDPEVAPDHHVADAADDGPPDGDPQSALNLMDDGEDLADDLADSQTDGAARGSRAAAGVPDAVVQRFRSFLAPLNLRHFDAKEFLALGSGHFSGGRGHGLNTAPPESLWPNIVATAEVLDALRERLGAPIQINSAYRSPGYNRAIGGESQSWHMQFRACDITASGVSAARVADAVQKMRDQGMFRGGIGRYASFTHVDTRGVNANWGRSRGPAPQSAGTTTDRAVRKLRQFADSIPQPRSAPRNLESDSEDALAQASAAVNGPQVLALAPELSPELRRAVLYSTQFAQRAADAGADPLRDRADWWATYNAALAAVGWVSKGSISREASDDDLRATLDALAIEVMTGLVGVGKLAAIMAMLDGLKNLAGDDRRLVLLDSHVSRKSGGAIQIGDAQLQADGDATLTTGAVQFSSSDNRKQVLFARWGSAVQNVWVAAERLVLNHDFYLNTAKPIVEQRLTDAQDRILAFQIDAQPLPA